MTLHIVTQASIVPNFVPSEFKVSLDESPEPTDVTKISNRKPTPPALCPCLTHRTCLPMLSHRRIFQTCFNMSLQEVQTDALLTFHKQPKKVSSTLNLLCVSGDGDHPNIIPNFLRHKYVKEYVIFWLDWKDFTKLCWVRLFPPQTTIKNNLHYLHS